MRYLIIPEILYIMLLLGSLILFVFSVFMVVRDRSIYFANSIMYFVRS